ncbi:capsule assembly Wzi family protein [Psychrosphaera aquimarina]|uniref:Capsule assembly Wzi family protein n=1 Tax=Psychrosphaera aquimarina TaxID=2044854 RepID=A0ABU3R1T1_9GAMM|nr:capsule assembly Wzi family protein [Psychrosphaera aquimarina]MDU0113635.1 capsule assembly Wzi family protein [Psychrosphaera aquimarina]
MIIKNYLVLLFFISSSALAGTSGYLPLKQSAKLERNIDQLLLMANMTSLKKPLSVSQVKQALNKVCFTRVTPLCTEITTHLKKYQSPASIVDGRIAVQLSDRTDSTLANQRGIEYQSNVYGHITGYSQLTEYLSFTAGAQLNGSDTSLENTYISVGTDWMQLDIGTKPHWLSPMENSAMLLSTHAPTLPTLSISNSIPLTDFGVNYELFVGELSNSDNIYYQGEYISGKPIITGFHLSVSPWQGFSLGVNRILQSGGGQRGSNSFSDLIGAFFDPSGSDNTSADLSVDEQFGNQAASLVSQFTFSGDTPFSLYFEYAGEDTSRGFNYKLGNSALSAGLYIPYLTDNIGLRVELSEWQNAWYVHHVYGDGLTHEGSIIGHWAAESRNRDNSFSGDGVGAYNAMAKLYWLQSNGDDITLSANVTQNESYTSYDYHTSYQVKAEWFTIMNEYQWVSSIEYGKDIFNESYYSISTSLAW